MREIGLVDKLAGAGQKHRRRPHHVDGALRDSHLNLSAEKALVTSKHCASTIHIISFGGLATSVSATLSCIRHCIPTRALHTDEGAWL